MSSPFPLLRLPRLVLFDVFKSLDIDEKIQLSICSKKISTEINNARFYSQKVIVDLDILRKKIRVHSENIKDAFDIFNCYDNGESNKPYIKQYRIEGHTVPVISYTTGMDTFWKNYREGFLSVTQHLLKMFQCKISADISIYHSDSLQPIISELFDLQVEFKTVTINLKGSEDENLLWNQISNNLELVEDLIISSSFYHSFRPVFTSWSQNICIWNSSWFTLEYLLTCTCTTITLGWSRLGNKDLDVVLKNWKAGGFLNLDRLTIDSMWFTNDEVLILDMNFRELNGMVIQTDDGSKKATVNTGYGRIEMSVTLFQ
ncbi:hypothetical protein GCK72_003132 [Caenorhabditis remanei]|uniref:F-box domain-containing protein n=1 Tax=Caenorhabditis remanei TaxID=31234 RepID=A0A6A5HWM5_CAERE|nr:hypothetical protein GCK72_003132 [Caenorhabditis remanei]KAF1771306.1 hypothetical protein GCK72_003132 [Caenorhabditis remanei]